MVLLIIWILLVQVAAAREHLNNWAVLIDTSTFWFNYRHVANVLSMYQIVKRLGIPDDHIILMLAEDIACNGRNSIAGTVYQHHDQQFNVYGTDVEVDYRGSQVSVETFIRVLTNRLPEGTPASKRLSSDANSNVLIYMTGHGGNNFLKFQDSEEINTHDLADAIDQMWQRQRYHELLLIVDTCQASTLFEQIRAPNVLAISSSARGESSYSHQVDDVLGVAVLDRFTYSILKFMQNVTVHSDVSVAELMNSLDVHFLGSTAEIRSDLFPQSLMHVRLLDFFGYRHQVVVDDASKIAIKAVSSSPKLPKNIAPIKPPRMAGQKLDFKSYPLKI